MRGILLMLLAVTATPAQTYSNEIRPIFAQHCIGCHSPGQVAPMAFNTYAQVRPWAAAIREATARGTMPPWQAAPGAPHAFSNNRSLPAAQIALIRAWVERGAPEGEPTLPLPAPASHTAWKLGRPDLVVEVPGFAVPRQGPLPYSFLILPLHLDRDTWVRAAEFSVDQPQVIHHLNAFIRPPGSSFLEGFPKGTVFVPTVTQRGKRNPGEALFARRELLLGYEPGYEPMPWLGDGAKLIAAGSDLVFEMHYNPNGTEAIDHSRLALYFSAAPPRYRVLAIDTLRDLDLAIPPQTASYRSEASLTFGEPARLLSLQPHMHVRGSSMTVRADYPNGSSEVLISVPHYDFNWQTTYVLAEPLDLPQGTRLISLAGYDNSANNAFNPDPTASVHWGDQTTDEMHIAFLELVIPRSQNPNTLFAAPPRMIGTATATAPGAPQ